MSDESHEQTEWTTHQYKCRISSYLMAERVGFEPTCRLPDKTLSRRPRYDHFGTSPSEEFERSGPLIIPHCSPRDSATRRSTRAIQSDAVNGWRVGVLWTSMARIIEAAL